MKIYLRFFCTVLALFFAYSLVAGYQSGEVTIKGNVSSLAHDPFFYWMWMIIQLVVLFVFVWLIFNPPKPQWDE